MNWDDVRVFLAVARAGTFWQAARALKLNHTTVGRRIDRLERMLAARLLERRTDGCRLTPAGERLLGIAERMDTEVLRGSEHLNEEQSRLAGTVRIGAPDGIGSYFLAARLAAFAADHPELVIQLVPLPRLFSLSKREADMAITIDRPSEGRLIAMKLIDYGVSLYASRDYLKRHGRISRPDDLGSRTLITYVDDLAYSQALDYAKQLERLASRRFECASVVGQLEAVRRGRGVAMLHDFIARQYKELVCVLPEIGATRSYWLVAHSDLRDLARVNAVWDFIAREVRASSKAFVRAKRP
jgi:DNA-binding transcriptional LysR family regulator